VSNQRRSFRIAVAAEQRGARLRVEGRDYKVVLEDESAGGFAVLVDGALMLKAGDRLPLHTNSGWSIVRVVHSTCQGAHTRIGFERVEDLPDMQSLDEIRCSWGSYLPGADYRGFAWSLCCVALLLAALGIAWFGRKGLVTTSGRSGRPAAVDDAQANRFQRFSKAFQDRLEKGAKTGTRIDLNAEQQIKIGAILLRAEQDILGSRSRGKRNAAFETQRMNAAEQEILSVLDEKQRANWEQLAENPPSLPVQ
jgi:hypothetical protein